MGNGTVEEATINGSIYGTVITENNAANQSIKLSNVRYLEKGKYNLLSVTQILKEGWKLEGDAHGM